MLVNSCLEVIPFCCILHPLSFYQNRVGENVKEKILWHSQSRYKSLVFWHIFRSLILLSPSHFPFLNGVEGDKQ